jgi:hypothetical protein
MVAWGCRYAVTDSGWPMPIPSRKRSLCLEAIRRYDVATSAASAASLVTC